MKPVMQSQFYKGANERGSCVQACIASIFELPESLAPTEREAYTWTTLHFPGLQLVRQDHEPQPTPRVPVGHHGFWIASVHTQTEGFTDPCGRCWEFEGNENGPPLCDPPRPCPICGEQWGLEKGVRPGYHAIVMRNAKIEHDPNPNADWDAERVYVGAAWWVASDPARIEPRRLPNAVARAARRYVEAERVTGTTGGYSFGLRRGPRWEDALAPTWLALVNSYSERGLSIAGTVTRGVSGEQQEPAA